MKKISLIIALLLSVISYAQMANDKGSISGQILDVEAGDTPLAFATVELIGTDQKVTTKIDGSFTIVGVEPGAHQLKVRFLGYEDYYSEELIIEADQTKQINYSMKAIDLNE